jgi:hypothetical protein
MPKKQSKSSLLLILLLVVTPTITLTSTVMGQAQQTCRSLYSLRSDSGQIYGLDGIVSGGSLEQYPNMTYVVVTGWFANSSHVVTFAQTFTVGQSTVTYAISTAVGAEGFPVPNYAGMITVQTVQVGSITYTFGMTIEIVRSTGSIIISTEANPHFSWAIPISISGRLFYSYVPCQQPFSPLGRPVVPIPLQGIWDALKDFWSWLRCLFGYCA